MQNTIPLKRKLLYSLATTVIFCTSIILLEIICRLAPPSKTLSQSLFFTEFKISRWEFLSARHEQLNVDWVLNVIAQRNASYDEPPEPNRPAFDRIPYPYTIQTNAQGFRDKNFPMHSGPSVILLGDSVGFGKGVAEEERFFSILNHQFPHIPFYNLALQGCTADCMTEVLEQYIEQLNPIVVIIQASSNDIDQALWREGVQHTVPNKPVPLWLKWHRHSYLSQQLQAWFGPSTIESLNHHSMLVEKHYSLSISKIFQMTDNRNIETVTIDLPFAYEWNYGGHLSRIGEKHESVTNVAVKFTEASLLTQQHNIPLQKVSDRFDLRTGKELGLSEAVIQQVFPHPEFFLDVVHLTPLGHRAVAEQVSPTLQALLK